MGGTLERHVLIRLDASRREKKERDICSLCHYHVKVLGGQDKEIESSDKGEKGGLNGANLHLTSENDRKRT